VKEAALKPRLLYVNVANYNLIMLD